MTDEQIEQAARDHADRHFIQDAEIFCTKPWDKAKKRYIKTLADFVKHCISRQWISVDKRLPEDDRLVIVHIDDLAYPSEISNCMGYFKNGRWQFPDDYYYDCHVTHWCEIPQLNH